VRPLRFQSLFCQSSIRSDTRKQPAFFCLEPRKKPLQRHFPFLKTQGMVKPRLSDIRTLDPKERNFDIDHDGVPDSLDCAPLNPYKQGEAHQTNPDDSISDEQDTVNEDAANQHILDALYQMQQATEEGDTPKYEALRDYFSDYVSSLSSKVKEKVSDTLNQLFEANILDREIISKKTRENIKKGLRFKKTRETRGKVSIPTQLRLHQLQSKEKLSPFYQEESVFSPNFVPYRPVGYRQSTLTGEDCAQGNVLWSPYREFKR
jgi:hypothetical protein